MLAARTETKGGLDDRSITDYEAFDQSLQGLLVVDFLNSGRYLERTLSSVCFGWYFVSGIVH